LLREMKVVRAVEFACRNQQRMLAECQKHSQLDDKHTTKSGKSDRKVCAATLGRRRTGASAATTFQE